jgi:hypothetical protein
VLTAVILAPAPAARAAMFCASWQDEGEADADMTFIGDLMHRLAAMEELHAAFRRWRSVALRSRSCRLLLESLVRRRSCRMCASALSAWRVMTAIGACRARALECSARELATRRLVACGFRVGWWRGFDANPGSKSLIVWGGKALYCNKSATPSLLQTIVWV